MIIVASGNLKHKNLVDLVKRYIPENGSYNRHNKSSVTQIKRSRPQLQTGLNVTSRKMTEGGAMKKEESRLDSYRGNQGKLPKYNKDPNG